MNSEELQKLIDRAKRLEVKHTRITKNLIIGEVISEDGETIYTPLVNSTDLTSSCGCMSRSINEQVCKHIVSILLDTGRIDLINKLIAQMEEMKKNVEV